jgi:predicted ATPase/class 3 adenylate cyclase
MRSDLPTGTVTFLFTDVEGSTKLLHELGAEAYAEALAEHRRLIREACAAQDGVEVDTQGDAFFFAFPTAPGALAAASAFTDALATTGPIQVRVGLHTGSPLLTDEGYIGDDVHFGARVASASHGGQVVISAATAELVEVELTDLGEHRLKDIPQAVSIYQLGDGSFPPLKTISNTNLPRPASSFVGRERETAEVVALLQNGARLVTLSGPGGSGKTRLSIEAASELVPEFKAGALWVGLATLRDPALVTETIAQTLGAKDGLAEHIGEREMLLVLDNLEQVIDSAPELGTLLEACPNLSLLVTSRELLRVRGEVEYAVPPLADPEAVSLFCERSQLESDETIAELCRRLDNLPLAVELAASRTSVLTPEQILERLSQRLDLLKSGRDAEARQQTLRATIEWSYDLLAPEERQLFARLSVFAGGCTLEAAEEVCDADLDTLQSLVEKSLLRFTDGRYWMLETIRQFAGERLAAAGGGDVTEREHAVWVLRLATRVGETRALDVPAREQFMREQDNFRKALAWAEDGHKDMQLALIGRSWLYWWDRGNAGEGLRWVEAALDRSAGEQTVVRADVLAAGAMFASRSGDTDTLRRYAEESLAIARELGDKGAEIWPLILLGIWAAEGQDYLESERRYEEAIAIARETGRRELVGITFNNLSVNATRQGDIERAVSLLDDARVISRELGALEDLAVETLNLADCLRRLERWDEAAEVAAEGLTLARELDSDRATLQGLEIIAAVELGRGDRGSATARLVGAAYALRDRLGEAVDRDIDVEAKAEQLAGRLGRETYERALREGRAMSMQEAVDVALASID